MAWLPKTNRAQQAERRKQHDRWRGSASSRGYDWDWAKLRAAKVNADPMCEICRAAPATEVDHKQPVDARPDLRLEWSNLQSLCHPCHARKTAREHGAAR